MSLERPVVGVRAIRRVRATRHVDLSRNVASVFGIEGITDAERVRIEEPATSAVGRRAAGFCINPYRVIPSVLDLAVAERTPVGGALFVPARWAHSQRVGDRLREFAAMTLEALVEPLLVK